MIIFTNYTFYQLLNRWWISSLQEKFGNKFTTNSMFWNGNPLNYIGDTITSINPMALKQDWGTNNIPHSKSLTTWSQPKSFSLLLLDLVINVDSLRLWLSIYEIFIASYYFIFFFVQLDVSFYCLKGNLFPESPLTQLLQLPENIFCVISNLDLDSKYSRYIQM